MKDMRPRDVLFSIADSQKGYFTASQARRAGISSAGQMYHVKSGNWIRRSRGVYRLKNYPVQEDEHYALWCVWSMNRKGEILGVLSHETALSIYELSDVNPVKIHMTVPRGFRRHGEIPSVLKLHFSPMHAPEYEQNGGYRVTRPFRTIADLVRGALLPADVIVQAVREGLRKGVLTRTQYAKLLEMPRVGNSLKRMMGDFA